MRHRYRHKRSRDEYERDNGVGVGTIVAEVRESTERQPRPSDDDANASPSDDADGWQQVRGQNDRKRSKKSHADASGTPSISYSPQARLGTHVKLGDLQNLVLYLLADGTAPQWCALRHRGNVRKVVAVMVPGLEEGMFDGTISFSAEQQPAPTSNSADLEQKDQSSSSHHSPRLPQVAARPSHVSPDDYYPAPLQPDRLPEPLRPLADIFQHVWPVKTPGDVKYAKMHSPMAAILSVPTPKAKEVKHGKGPQPPREGKGWKDKHTPITEFVASTAELVEAGYVLHPSLYHETASPEDEAARRVANKQTTHDGWIDTPGVAGVSSHDAIDSDRPLGSAEAKRKVFALDCEMCVTSLPGAVPQVLSLTRVSMVDWDGITVLDELVKPAEPVTDYLTPYSGITPAMLKNVTTTLADIQNTLISDLLRPNTILIGHSLNSDLNALKLAHPHIVDTSILFPHPRGPPLKSSLKWLAQRYLAREIQQGHGSLGHDSVEDAKACLDLVKQKCIKGKTWGTSEASSESIFARLARQERAKREKVDPSGDNEYRTGAVVDWGDPHRGYGAQAHTVIGCESDADVAMGVKQAINGSCNDAESSNAGVDFVFARLRELEAYRGWWNRSKTTDNQALLDTTQTSTSTTSLASVTAATVQRIQEIWHSLPAGTAFVVYSGSGDPRALSKMQALQTQFKQEYRVKKWDELSVRWTDVEQQTLLAACEVARRGIGFVTVRT